MVRILLSTRESGPYEYSFDHVTEESLGRVIEKFLRKYIVVRRIRLNPVDRYERIRLTIELREKYEDYREKLRLITTMCNEKCSGELRVETGSADAVVGEVAEMLRKTSSCFEECVKEVLGS